MRVWIAATLLICSGLVFASGQPPQPVGQHLSRPEQAVQHQQQPANAQQKPTEDQRGSEQTPLVVKVYKAQESDKEAQQEQHDRGDRAKSDSRMFWVGILTFVILCVQAGVFYWQGGQLKRTVVAMRDEFTATHRPHIKLRHIWVEGEFWGGQEISIKVQIVNVGSTDAKIIQRCVSALILPKGRQLPMPQPYWKDGFQPEISEILRSGISHLLPPFPILLSVAKQDNEAIRKGEKIIYCFGYVLYDDSSGNRRMMGFCRQHWFPTTNLASHSAERGRFKSLEPKDIDYEYDD